MAIMFSSYSFFVYVWVIGFTISVIMQNVSISINILTVVLHFKSD